MEIAFQKEYSLEMMCRRNDYSTIEKQTIFCGYICPENTCIYRSEIKKTEELLYRCMNLDKRWR